MKKAILTTEIDLRLRPSKILWGWGWLFSILTLYALISALPWRWAALGSMVYMLTGVWHWLQCPATGLPWSIQSVNVDVFGQLSLTDAREQRWLCTVLPNSVVHPACLILRVHAMPMVGDNEGMAVTFNTWSGWLRPRNLLILPDQADTQALRALRVWLRWGLSQRHSR